MPFKMITLSEKEVARIAGNAGTHADLMARTLTDRWRRDLPPEQTIIDVLQLQLCVRDDLHRLRVQIREIEKEHLERLEIARLGREVRNVAIPQLRGRLIGIQRLFDGTYGAGSSTAVFGEDTVSIPTDPFPLLRLAHIARGRLVDPGFTLPESQFSGVEIVPASLAASFEPALLTLEQALEGLEENLPATNASLAKKIETLDELRRQAGVAARFLEALYALAGHIEIARRVRRSSHQARDVDPVEVDEGGGPDEPDDPAGAPAIEPGLIQESVVVTAPAVVVERDAERAA